MTEHDQDQGLTWNDVAGRTAEEVAEATAQIREERARKQARQELDAYRDLRRQAWLDAGGTHTEFLNAWPMMKAEYLYEKTRGFSHEEKIQRSNLADMRF